MRDGDGRRQMIEAAGRCRITQKRAIRGASLQPEAGRCWHDVAVQHREGVQDPALLRIGAQDLGLQPLGLRPQPLAGGPYTAVTPKLVHQSAGAGMLAMPMNLRIVPFCKSISRELLLDTMTSILQP